MSRSLVSENLFHAFQCDMIKNKELADQMFVRFRVLYTRLQLTFTM